MALNFVRGFRRIGWVITFPVAALIVLVFYENTKEFSPFNYEATQTAPPSLPAGFFSKLAEAQNQVKTPPGTVLMPPPGSDYTVELSGIGTAWFSGEVPKDVVEQVLHDFEAKHKTRDEALKRGGQMGQYKLSDIEQPQPPVVNLPPRFTIVDDPLYHCWTFTVSKRVNKLKLAGLLSGSVVIPALIIQGSISILAWVFRGFKG